MFETMKVATLIETSVRYGVVHGKPSSNRTLQGYFFRREREREKEIASCKALKDRHVMQRHASHLFCDDPQPKREQIIGKYWWTRRLE